MSVQSNLADLNAVTAQYQRLSGKTNEEVLAKQATKLAYNLRANLAAIRPEKGAIRNEALARLRSGRGIAIRPGVRQEVLQRVTKIAPTSRRKLLRKGTVVASNRRMQVQQEMIRREIAVRESGRGVLAVSAKYPGSLASGKKAFSRYGLVFSQFDMAVSDKGGVAVFDWRGINRQSSRAAKGLQGPRGAKAIADAIAATTADTLVYVQRKQMEQMQAMVSSLTGAFKKL